MENYQESDNASGPLAGLRVVEMGQLLAGPFCGQMLGDLGADVIKIEDPGKGDPMRQWGRELAKGESLWWSVIGRNKKSVTINLREPEGQGLAKDLISTADILIENFRPGTMERWGLGYETLHQTHPGIIMVRVSGFGQDGPYSHRAGYGAIGEAMGGLRYVVGDPSTPPSRVGISIGDTLAALFATIGALAALREREISGEGQVVDSSIYEAVLGVMESLVPEWQVNGYQRERTGGILPNVAPSNIYPTKEGEWILIAANQDTVFKRLCDFMSRPELADDPKYRSHQARGENQAELDDLIAEFTVTKDSDELESGLSEHGVPSGKIYKPVDMFSDPQYKARESIIEVEHPVLGEVSMQNVFPRMTRTRGSVRWPGPALGQHTKEVLIDIGLDDERFASLWERGIV